jgi:hypothetical protein
MEGKVDISEAIHVRGDVTIRVKDRSGTIIKAIEMKNLVVAVGKTILAHRLSGDAAYASHYIAAIKFGTGTVAPAAGDTGLGSAQFSAPVTASYPATNKARYSAAMDYAEGGSLTYSEMGLFTADAVPKMFSRLLIGPILKSSAYRIEVDWDISFQ